MQPTQNDPSVSFVIPAYNCENTLEEAVDSIFNGNFNQGDEVVIVNDSSTDNTKSVAGEICLKHKSFIRLINNEQNKGCPASRNIGIKEAKNPLIFNLDSDDILEKNSVNKLKKYLQNNDADLAAFGEIHFFKKNPKKITHKWLCKTGQLTLSDYLSGQIVPGGNYIYTKSSWEKIGGYWEYGKGLHEFWGFSFKQLVYGAKFMVMPDSYYFHRYSHNSLFRRENKEEESMSVTNKFIEPIFGQLSKDSQEYVTKQPNWFYHLNKIPLMLKNHAVGEKGRVVFISKIIRIKNFIKKLAKKS